MLIFHIIKVILKKKKRFVLVYKLNKKHKTGVTITTSIYGPDGFQDTV